MTFFGYTENVTGVQKAKRSEKGEMIIMKAKKILSMILVGAASVRPKRSGGAGALAKTGWRADTSGIFRSFSGEAGAYGTA